MNTDYTFADASARDASLPSPNVGATCFLRSTGELLIYYGAPFGWRPPWNTSWGEVAAYVHPSDSAIANVGSNHYYPQAAHVAPFTPIKGRAYRLDATLFLWGALDNDIVAFVICYVGGPLAFTSATAAPTLIKSAIENRMTGIAAVATSVSRRFTTELATACGEPGGFVLAATNIIGTGGFIGARSQIIVTDAGPYAPPSTS